MFTQGDSKKLIDKILASAIDQVNELLTKEQKIAQREIEIAQEKEKVWVEQEIAKIELKYKNLFEREISKARLDARKDILNQKCQIIDDLIDKVRLSLAKKLRQNRKGKKIILDTKISAKGLEW